MRSLRMCADCLAGKELIDLIGIIRTRQNWELVSKPTQHGRIKHLQKILHHFCWIGRIIRQEDRAAGRPLSENDPLPRARRAL